MEAAAYPSPAVMTATGRSPRLWSFAARLSAGGIPDELVCRHGDAPATAAGRPAATAASRGRQRQSGDVRYPLTFRRRPAGRGAASPCARRGVAASAKRHGGDRGGGDHEQRGAPEPVRVAGDEGVCRCRAVSERVGLRGGEDRAGDGDAGGSAGLAEGVVDARCDARPWRARRRDDDGASCRSRAGTRTRPCSASTRCRARACPARKLLSVARTEGPRSWAARPTGASGRAEPDESMTPFA